MPWSSARSLDDYLDDLRMNFQLQHQSLFTFQQAFWQVGEIPMKIPLKAVWIKIVNMQWLQVESHGTKIEELEALVKAQAALIEKLGRDSKELLRQQSKGPQLGTLCMYALSFCLVNPAFITLRGGFQFNVAGIFLAPLIFFIDIAQTFEILPFCLGVPLFPKMDPKTCSSNPTALAR